MISKPFYLTCLFFINFLTFQITWAQETSSVTEKVEFCFGCHGDNGNSMNPQFPKLAGQTKNYLRNQLTAFKNKERLFGPMNAIAAKLSSKDIDYIASYFTQQEITSAGGGDSELAKQGAVKFKLCAGCHGSLGKGNGQFPRLAGQHPDYLARQLKRFKSGERKSGPMQTITREMDETDMSILSAYIGSL